MNNTIHNEGRGLMRKVRNIFPNTQQANNVLSFLINDIFPNMVNEQNHYNQNELEGLSWEHIQEWFETTTPITDEQAKQLENVIKEYIRNTYSSVPVGGRRKKTRKHKKRSKKTRKH